MDALVWIGVRVQWCSPGRKRDRASKNHRRTSTSTPSTTTRLHRPLEAFLSHLRRTIGEWDHHVRLLIKKKIKVVKSTAPQVKVELQVLMRILALPALATVQEPPVKRHPAVSMAKDIDAGPCRRSTNTHISFCFCHIDLLCS